jgi:hypothetical protein
MNGLTTWQSGPPPSGRPLTMTVRRNDERAASYDEMPVIPARRRPTRWKAAIRFVGILVLLLIVVGLMIDLFSGPTLSLSSRSWTTWLLGIVALGVL